MKKHRLRKPPKLKAENKGFVIAIAIVITTIVLFYLYVWFLL